MHNVCVQAGLASPPKRRCLRNRDVAAWYADRESGTPLRRLPEWIPVWVARTHAIYLRGITAPYTKALA